MKHLCAILAFLVLATPSHAGWLGWLTAKTRDWEFIQRTGGIRIAAPREIAGRMMLRVEYDVTGLRTITCQPTMINSGLVVRNIRAVKKSETIVLWVTTQAVEKKSATGAVHFVDVSVIPSGSYEVFYETVGDPVKRLGRIDVK